MVEKVIDHPAENAGDDMEEEQEEERQEQTDVDRPHSVDMAKRLPLSLFIPHGSPLKMASSNNKKHQRHAAPTPAPL
ncbi:hypothetical protein VTN00DRAFT_6493 [Thermoascus crustaceus]|uniref:uncharacterized protein n=1 Tax=Thermoascus crustaceus TaxID=5088 RepID=UPI0037426604